MSASDPKCLKGIIKDYHGSVLLLLDVSLDCNH